MSDVVKKTVEDFLKTKAVLSITPKVVDPDYTYLNLEINTLYDETKTTISTDALASSIRSAVISNIKNNR